MGRRAAARRCFQSEEAELSAGILAGEVEDGFVAEGFNGFHAGGIPGDGPWAL